LADRAIAFGGCFCFASVFALIEHMADAPQSSTNNNLLFFGLLAAVLVVYLFILRPLNRRVTDDSHPAIGSTFPEFSLSPLSSDNKTTSSRDLAGKVVLVNFWATWCPPCRLEFPHIVEIDKKYQDNPDFRMVSIACPTDGDTDETLRTAVEGFLRERKASLPVYLDTYGNALQAISISTGAAGGIPLTVVVDREGIVRGIWEGYAPGVERAVEAKVQELLGDKQATKSAAAWRTSGASQTAAETATRVPPARKISPTLFSVIPPIANAGS
jgi:cytochrome c biogenesis protein CcmG, thiol:disulfide interchange protein DsbE